MKMQLAKALAAAGCVACPFCSQHRNDGATDVVVIGADYGEKVDTQYFNIVFSGAVSLCSRKLIYDLAGVPGRAMPCMMQRKPNF